MTLVGMTISFFKLTQAIPNGSHNVWINPAGSILAFIKQDAVSAKKIACCEFIFWLGDIGEFSTIIALANACQSAR
ncbi:hypothetical protein PSQ19_15855 [Devosia algicola]|uniref:Uncharacterized protein n=1 Tax=Devosia algicola TaxID=3026418 RepID=A0ABY7YLE4_9HYPH|nr:hypothetical protein [Devosia algicola]WDR02121.1 hypothetical protein PSQ19_15855 [Devosia algicola]